MKLVLALVACLFFGNGLADTDDGLRYFDLSAFSDGFKRYEAAGCSDEVNTCMREMHENAQRCIGLWKQQAGDRFRHCVQNDPVVVNATKDWETPSFKWHKAMDKCLSGNQAPTAEALQSLAIEQAAMSYYSRRKRSNAAMSEEVTTCWRNSRAKKDACKQKAAQCTQFAHCYGEGESPADESKKRWFDHIKHLRSQTHQKSKIYIMHMGHCLRNEPHTSGDGGHDHHGMH